MRVSYILTASIALLQATTASPAGHNPETQLESRATRSSQGWYAYGCYMEQSLTTDCYDGMNRYLPTLAYRNAENTPTKCIDACRGLGKNYAGLQYGNECWCGDKLAGPPTKPQECDKKCTDGNKCGGACRNNIWSSLKKPGH